MNEKNLKSKYTQIHANNLNFLSIAHFASTFCLFLHSQDYLFRVNFITCGYCAFRLKLAMCALFKHRAERQWFETSWDSIWFLVGSGVAINAMASEIAIPALKIGFHNFYSFCNLYSALSVLMSGSEWIFDFDSILYCSIHFNHK